MVRSQVAESIYSLSLSCPRHENSQPSGNPLSMPIAEVYNVREVAHFATPVSAVLPFGPETPVYSILRMSSQRVSHERTPLLRRRLLRADAHAAGQSPGGTAPPSVAGRRRFRRDRELLFPARPHRLSYRDEHRRRQAGDGLDLSAGRA